ncbi:MAG: 50S ribosomal protein L21 [Alphaproteobacteria bacterium]|jgi:large subunit ribosomal protein L21|nr:50S ribosomal protein L21 [Alphaproteobacteria bacterium]
MFAVIRTGGKQYRVSPDDVIKIERLADVDAGNNIELTDVLAMGDGDSVTLGTPVVDGARVVASVLEHKRDTKIIVFKKKRRKNYRRTQGHRQNITILRIEEILAAGEKASPKKKAAAKPAADAGKATDDAPAKKAAAKKAPAKKAAAADKPAAKKAAAKKAPAKKATKDSDKE